MVPWVGHLISINGIVVILYHRPERPNARPRWLVAIRSVVDVHSSPLFDQGAGLDVLDGDEGE